MATVTFLEVAKAMLADQGGGYAAIVSGEHFSESIDKGNKENEVF